MHAYLCVFCLFMLMDMYLYTLFELSVKFSLSFFAVYDIGLFVLSAY